MGPNVRLDFLLVKWIEKDLFVLKILVEVAARIEKLKQDFLWLGFSKGKRDHLIGWEYVCKSKGDGGLGLRRITLRLVVVEVSEGEQCFIV